MNICSVKASTIYENVKKISIISFVNFDPEFYLQPECILTKASN